MWDRLDPLAPGKRHVHRPHVVLVAAGLVLRVVTVALYFPTVLQWIDVVRFSRLGPCRGLVSDLYTPAGDAVFPKITHTI